MYKKKSGGEVGSRGPKASVWLALLVLSNVLVFQLTYRHRSISNVSQQRRTIEATNPELPMGRMNSSSALDVPQGTAVALPSVRISEEEDKTIKRKIYGGQGDKQHLGGFTDIDLQGVSPAVWKYMINYFGVKSLLDVGCGRGISTSWFALHGVDVLCVEGSHDAVTKNMLPDPKTQIVEHDFSRGPWWPPRTVDAVWSVEFLEHVGRNFHHNYIPAFRKAALIFVTHSNWGGWHHVEVHSDDWWIAKMELYGFRYSEDLTKKVRGIAGDERGQKIASPVKGETYNAQHVWGTLMIFINPVVAALPEHAHLLSEFGCYKPSLDGHKGRRECGTEGNVPESKLPASFYPLNISAEMDEAWNELVKKNIKQK